MAVLFDVAPATVSASEQTVRVLVERLCGAGAIAVEMGVSCE